jgi:hypothetical protein
MTSVADDDVLRTQVAQRARLERAKNATGFKHVYKEGCKFKAMIKATGKFFDLGLFEHPVSAALAVARRQLTA